MRVRPGDRSVRRGQEVCVAGRAGVADKLTQYKSWEANNARRIAREFPDLVQQRIAKALEEFKTGLPDHVQQVLSQRESKQTADSFFDDNEKELFELDATGEVKLDAAGDAVLTKKSRRFANTR